MPDIHTLVEYVGVILSKLIITILHMLFKKKKLNFNTVSLIFRNSYSLEKHERLHRYEGLYCQECGRVFKTKEELDSHDQ